MNIQNLPFDYVEQHRLYPPRFWGPETPSDKSQVTVLPYHEKHHDSLDDYDDDSRPPSPSPQPTVVPYAPSPPPNSHSPPELYGPDRVFGPPLVAPVYDASRSFVHFDEAQIAMDAASNAGRQRSLGDEIYSIGGQVTPGVDDTPYIQYALDALTREDGAHYTLSLPSGSSDAAGYVGSSMMYDPVIGYAPALDPIPPAITRDSVRISRPSARLSNGAPPEIADPVDGVRPWTLAAFDDRSPSLSSSNSDHVRPKPVPKPLDTVNWMEVDDKKFPVLHVKNRKNFPRLNHKPWILRPVSLFLLMILCVLMITALMFSAIYSSHHTGLTNYGGSIYSGQYFLFRILPQILAAFLLLYAQGVITTCFRLLPFAEMADENPRRRLGALFQDLYPKSFLWPHLLGPWQIKTCIFVTWMMNFTLPLQSAAFTVIYVDQEWIWTAVQGPVWTLVCLYFLMIGALIFLMLYWHNRTTGVMWDVRSIADMVPMINRSNNISDYAGSEALGTRKELKSLLRNHAVDRLGYWRVAEPKAAVWYGIGVNGRQVNLPPKEVDLLLGKKAGKEARHSASTLDMGGSLPEYSHVRHRYLPWCMRNNQLIYFVVAGSILLIALFVVSFVQGTRLTQGFKPELSAQPGAGAFSPANFLYSFLPSLLGLVLFLLFQALDQSIRILQPWAELSSPHGAPARTSILLDYAACLPFEAAFKAARNRHWRVAFISLIAALFVFLPILAGGLFMALTVSRTGEVRMFPNVPVFGVVLGLLVLFLVGLAAMLPSRQRYRLPHAVTCPAEIISLCNADEFRGEAAFRMPRSKFDLLTRLGAGLEERQQPRWYFGHAPGRDERLSVRQMSRFTERTSRSGFAEKTPRSAFGSARGSRWGSQQGSHRVSQRTFHEKRAPRPFI